MAAGCHRDCFLTAILDPPVSSVHEMGGGLSRSVDTHRGTVEKLETLGGVMGCLLPQFSGLVNSRILILPNGGEESLLLWSQLLNSQDVSHQPGEGWGAWSRLHLVSKNEILCHMLYPGLEN